MHTSLRMILLSAGLSGCASQSGTMSADGYGARPQDPRVVIASLVSNPEVRVIDDPDPFYVRDERGWHYGWRVCSETADGHRAFFLMRGDRVIYSAVPSADEPRSLASEDVARNCPDHKDG